MLEKKGEGCHFLTRFFGEQMFRPSPFSPLMLLQVRFSSPLSACSIERSLPFLGGFFFSFSGSPLCVSPLQENSGGRKQNREKS